MPALLYLNIFFKNSEYKQFHNICQAFFYVKSGKRGRFKIPGKAIILQIIRYQCVVMSIFAL